jgi:hypothetical protein
VWHARTSKNTIFWKIEDKYFYSSYSNETFYIKSLEYKVKEYFTVIDLGENILKSLEDIQVFLDMKNWMFGQAASKYKIVLVCLILWRQGQGVFYFTEGLNPTFRIDFRRFPSARM